jgi:hypothetical protein
MLRINKHPVCIIESTRLNTIDPDGEGSAKGGARLGRRTDKICDGGSTGFDDFVAHPTHPTRVLNTVLVVESEITRQIGVVGAERSGSTLLRLMLDHHPNIAFEHEFDLAVEMVSDDGSFPPVEVYRKFLSSVRGMNYVINPSLTFSELVNDFLNQKLARSGKVGYVGATVHHHFDRLIYLWPDAPSGIIGIDYDEHPSSQFLSHDFCKM